MQEVTIPIRKRSPYGSFSEEALQEIDKVHSPKSKAYDRQYSYTYIIEDGQLSLARLYGEPRSEIDLGKIKEFIVDHFEQLKDLPEGLGRKICTQVNLLIDKSHVAHMSRVIQGFCQISSPIGVVIPIPSPPIARIVFPETLN